MSAAGHAPEERQPTPQVASPATGPVPGPPGAGAVRPGAQAAQQVQRPAGDAGPAGAGRAGDDNRFRVGPRDRRNENEPSPVKGAGERNGPGPGREPGSPLLEGSELQRMVIRWRENQAHFVDEPRTAVERADALVADLMQQLAAMFARERAQLEQRWADGDGASTEELRQSLRGYRLLFERLLAA